MSQAYMPKAKSDHWPTPDRVYQEAKQQGWDIENFFDPCPLHSTFDGLTIPWNELNYVNPPYSTLRQWVKKAWIEWAIFQHSTVLLLPVKTDQAWFHNRCKLFKIHFFEGRLKFKNAKYNATQPHMLVFMDARKV